MNIQFGQRQSPRPTGGNLAIRLWPKMWFAVKTALFCLAVAALFNGNIYLRQKIAETERGIRRTEREIAGTRREIERLRVDYAELTGWPYIRRRIAEFKLPLRPPLPGQIRDIRLHGAPGLRQAEHAPTRTGKFAAAR